ncbi:hypothetical protein [Mycoplasmopsis agassizii]|uniref:Uncharacterized protein n=1 Tax=Mycoplasmopsis agassizii TaxID=33922 RepID=A0ABX4H5T0_9BACT|nr:hypothetical protein [Mycoplasmopsis agassizii]PAF55263.1 hypothetical protein CJF60_01070 [Mycoplasmopsis agassizii]SMC15681.1 hypothetical protein SAMN02745179_00031 [Mycoplasmopsis agassizii]
MKNKKLKITTDQPTKTLKALKETHNMEETIHRVDINQETGRAKLHFEAEGDPKPIVVTPPGPIDPPPGWDWEEDDLPFDKKWVMIRIQKSADGIIKSLGSQINEIRVQNMAINSKVDTLYSKVDNLEAQNKELYSKVDKLEIEVSELKSQNEAIVKQNDELKTQNNAIVKQNDELKTQNNAIVKQNDELKTQNEIIVKQNEKIVEQLKEILELVKKK